MLTHRNLCANIGAIYHFDGEFEFKEDDVYISYLPLAHVLERFFMIASMANKLQYGFYQGEVTKLKEDLQELKPTIMISVPRLWNRFYDVIKQKIAEAPYHKRMIAEWGIAKKLHNLEKSAQTTHALYDRIVFNKFRETLGGRVRVMLTGSAPISKDVLNFLKVCFCVQIHEGYGQTESAAPASLTWSKDPTCGHVGAPYPTCDFKLVDVPDMKYTSEDKDEHGNPMPRGEICYKGYNCFKGYFHNKKQTVEAIDEDGWVHTGDVGSILPNGCIKIIDRKKNLFKLSQGEYIVPDKLENKFAQSHYIAQIFVYGDSFQNYVVAIIVPEKETLIKWAKEKGLPTDDYEELLKNEQVVKLFESEIKAKAKEAGVNIVNVIVYSSLGLKFLRSY